MPNWVTNKVSAPEHVIRAMLNDEGKVDFNNACPFPGKYTWDGIILDAETAAEQACGFPISSHPLLADLEAQTRSNIDLQKMTEESFAQFIGMLENYRQCGYLHQMDFARHEWGTKWNACESTATPEQGVCEFDTAWSCPTPVFLTMSKRFPDDEIKVVFADEDIGSNCGTLVFKGGELVSEDVASGWDDMTDEQKAKWRQFAYDVKGWRPDLDDDEDE